jgi:hypothetical protein
MIIKLRGWLGVLVGERLSMGEGEKSLDKLGDIRDGVDTAFARTALTPIPFVVRRLLHYWCSSQCSS